MTKLQGFTRLELCMRLDYDPETGVFKHKGKMRNRKCGSLTQGYVIIVLDTVRLYGHRLAWFMMTGEVPVEVDHCNRVRNDNRWSNLRHATRKQNSTNTLPVSKASKLPKGVHFCRDTGRYRAQVKLDGKKYCLGRHDTPEQASAAYEKKAASLFGEFARAS